MVRKSDLIQSVKDNWDNSDIEKFFKKSPNFVTEISGLKQLQKEYQAANEDLKKDPNNINQQETVSQYQIEIARHINKLVYSKNLWKGQEGNFSFQSILDQKVNCIARGELIYRLHKHFFDEEILAGTKEEHLFSFKRLANGKFLSLDGRVEEIVDLEQWKRDNTIYSVGLHSNLYQFYILDSVAKTAPFEIAETLFQEAIRLVPNDPQVKNNLANLLAKHPERWQEAEKLYWEAVRLNPDNPYYKSSLANLLAKQPERWQEAEKLYQEAITKSQELDKYKYSKTWLMTSKATFYLGGKLLDKASLSKFQKMFSDENGTARGKSKILLKETLRLMRLDKKYENFLTEKEIKSIVTYVINDKH